MVFGCRKSTPPSCHAVDIGSHAEIGSMYMRVSAILVDQIGFTKTLSYVSRVLIERIYGHDAGNGFNSGLSKSQLVGKPSDREFAIGIRIGKPATLQWSGVTTQSDVCRQRPCATDHTEGRSYCKAAIAKLLSSEGESVIDATISD
jgi:hypothetical protein